MSIKCPVLPRGAPPTGRGPSADKAADSPKELDPVLYHLQAALQYIRDLPVHELEREKFITLVYQILSSANTLVVEDLKFGQPNLVYPPDPPSADLMSDLDLIK